MHFNDLPAEIRLSIFRLATLKISQHEDTLPSYRPFAVVPLRARDWSASAQHALDMKSALVLVCKEWKAIATELLYECVRVQHGTRALVAALEGSAGAPLDDGNCNARWVRRVEISEQVLDFDPFNPVEVVRVLERCPFVETIVRPCMFERGGVGLGAVKLGTGETFPTLKSVRRIDWWTPNVIYGGWPGSAHPKPDFLSQLLAHAPNVEYVALAVPRRWERYDTWGRRRALFVPQAQGQGSGVDPKAYEKIHTLRLEGEVEASLMLAGGASEVGFLPNLRRLVVDASGLSRRSQVLEQYGRNIHSVELLNVLDERVLGTKLLLRACPNLRELYVPLGMGAVLLGEHGNESDRVVLEDLKCIRIKMDSSSSSTLTSPHLGYFMIFMRDKLDCPSLERIVLDGSVEMWKEDPCYAILEEFVSRRRFLDLDRDQIADLPSSDYEDTAVDYRPFEAVPLREREWSSSAQQALDVKMAIVLVCKEWKKMTTEYLYECIRIQQGTQALLIALEGHSGTGTPFDNARWVKRVEISERILDFDPFNPVMILRVLERCPLVETIVRPCMLERGGVALSACNLSRGEAWPTFRSVRRIDWWIPGVLKDSWSHPKPEFLDELLDHAPNVRYLTLAVPRGWERYNTLNRRNALFVRDAWKCDEAYGRIRTLRLEGDVEATLVLAGDASVVGSLPGLRRLVLDASGIARHSAVVEKYGRNIQSVELLELAPGPRNAPPDASPGKLVLGTNHLLRACPNLRELCVPLGLGGVLLSENGRVVLGSLKCIRIKMDASMSPLASSSLGYFIRDSLDCPSLERIVLYGSVARWKENACYGILEELVSRNRFLVLEFAGFV
ncbi:hypothetical protein CVT26_003130 [Gymnopilus dilepis]|uniref:F-box domain-containing protein n=1 Tax=Gymnopilus dilepis TaxID=231916 RepID=A0A409Y4U6_9AGAR|nr:hypothetical protein CVT26_003130 [Gymnopilus dilepis]